jgi:bifunctional non-homologous end joining protein LigD
MNLWRWNAGIAGKLVVQQDIPKGAPDWVKRAETPRRKGGSIEHVLCQDAATLRWLANQNCITPHVWTARRDMLDRPDRLVFDLDPPEGTDFAVVREAALATGETLRELGLEPFAMVTGSKGIHVVAPIKRTRETLWVRERAGELGAEIAGRSPDTLTTEWRKDKREGRILVDTARNTYGQTVVAPYAVRAIPGAPVATPVRWEEVEDPSLTARSWTLRTVGERLASDGDAWAEISRHARPMPG